MTTVLRAIGIPARSVTNYNSAHDTDNTMTIDKFINEEGEDVEELNNDSVWYVKESERKAIQDQS